GLCTKAGTRKLDTRSISGAGCHPFRWPPSRFALDWCWQSSLSISGTCAVLSPSVSSLSRRIWPVLTNPNQISSDASFLVSVPFGFSFLHSEHWSAYVLGTIDLVMMGCRIFETIELGLFACITMILLAYVLHHLYYDLDRFLGESTAKVRR